MAYPMEHQQARVVIVEERCNQVKNTATLYQSERVGDVLNITPFAALAITEFQLLISKQSFLNSCKNRFGNIGRQQFKIGWHNRNLLQPVT